jgi:outer membrane protein assembly factor BamB
MRRPAAVLSSIVLLTAGPAAACASTPAAPSSESSHTPSASAAAAARTFANWPTFHRTVNRAGRAVAAVGRLHHAWTKPLKGAVYGEPLMINGTLIVATERNNVYALNPRTGHIRWRSHFGTPVPLSHLPCGNIDPLGTTSTPAYDPKTHSVFVVAETTGAHHTLWAVNPANGHKRWHRSLDTQKNRNRHAEQQRAALRVTHGRVITTFGGLAGDCDNYVGYVTSAPVSGKGKIHSYDVPTPREAGIWATSGPVVGRNGHVYVSTGNGAKTSGRWDKSDSVTELTPITMRRVSAFAPSTWRQDNAADLDLGSSSPIPVSHRIVIAGKRGVVYLLREKLGGVGSAIRKLDGCTAFSGGAIVDAHTVLMPCLGENAVRELHVTKRHISFGWTASGVYSSPVTAGQRVYVADRNSGDLVVLRRGNGNEIQRLHAGNLTHFPSATISGGMVFVPTLDGITAFAD